MEISSITGPDYMPTGFSTEPPRTEKTEEQQREEVRREPSPDEKGGRIDTYA